jgi:hypothetical protein
VQLESAQIFFPTDLFTPAVTFSHHIICGYPRVSHDRTPLDGVLNWFHQPDNCRAHHEIAYVSTKGQSEINPNGPENEITLLELRSVFHIKKLHRLRSRTPAHFERRI